MSIEMGAPTSTSKNRKYECQLKQCTSPNVQGRDPINPWGASPAPEIRYNPSGRAIMAMDVAGRQSRASFRTPCDRASTHKSGTEPIAANGDHSAMEQLSNTKNGSSDSRLRC